MQKDDKFYSFLLSRSTKRGIYIKRVSIRKGYLHFSSMGFLLVLGFTTFAAGISGFVNSDAFAASLAQTSMLTQIAAQPTTRVLPTESLEPAGPTPAGDFALNSGGPLENDEIGDNSDLDAQLRLVQANAVPANLPTMWAHLGKINNEFGFRRNPFGGRTYEFHPGMDIDGDRGDLVVAPGNGTVIAAGYKGGYGNMVEIDHGNGLTTRYGHLSKIESAAGDTVTRGQLIAYIGSTGRSTGPHLHYELRLNDKPINPRHFLPAEPTDLSKIEKR